MQPGLQIDQYRIDKLLGRGGMGEVYLATDLKLNRLVALKVLRKEISEDKTSASRFRREALAASSITHPNISNIYNIGEVDGRMYIAMEYIDGKSLIERIRDGPAGTNEVIEIGIQIADALEEARKKNIVHRDIKSSNILLTNRNQAKLVDFGLAKSIAPSTDLSNESTETHLTKSGMVIGTVSYMSPEQALGHTVDHRSDIFSFGVVLYEMLTAKLPFSGNTQTEVIDAVLHKDPPPISRFNDKVPDSLTRVIQKMLQKNIDERYQSVHEVWTDLRHIQGQSVTTSQTSKSVRSSRKSMIIAAALIAIALLAGLFIYHEKNKQQNIAVTNISSIVALPCKVYGAPEVAYLTDAIPATLSTLLTQVDGLETKMPPSSVEVEQLNGDMDKLANAYNVNAFVVSSITAEANRLTINLQLIDPKSRRVLWGNQYPGTRATYNEMTTQAAEDIRQVIRPISNTIASSNGLARSSEAELAFRQGLHYSFRYNRQKNPADFDAAFKAFKRSLELDPKFADAAAEISWIYAMKSEEEVQPEKSIADANMWARKALAINNRCSKAWSGLYGSGLADSLEYGLRGVKYGPKDSYAHNTLGLVLNSVSATLALNAYETASSLDPLYLQPAGNAASVLWNLGRYEEALSKSDTLLEIEPNFGLLGKGFVLVELNRLEELPILLQKIEKLKNEGKLPAWKVELLRYVVAESSNQKALAEELLNRIKQNFASRKDVYYWIILNDDFIPFLIREQKNQEAIFALTQELKFDYTVPYELFLVNPYYKTLHKEPQLQNHIARSREKLDQTISLLEEARKRDELPQYLEKPLNELRSQIEKL